MSFQLCYIPPQPHLAHSNGRRKCDFPPRVGVPLLVALADVMQQNVVLQRVGDEPLGVGVLAAMLDAVLVLGQLEELVHGRGLVRCHHKHA